MQKIIIGKAVLEDQAYALTNCLLSYFFAKSNITGTDIVACQEKSCETAECAYAFVRDVPGANIEYCRKACEHDKNLLDKFDKMIIEKVML